MKTIYFVIVFYVLSFNLVLGKIRNGYEPQLQSNRVSLQKLNLLLLEKKDLTNAQRLRIKSEIENLIDYISYYELTETLIDQLKMVSPDIYIEIDSIKDRRGRPTDVYIKLIPAKKSRTQLAAASFIKRTATDADANLSEYGEYSTSVDICAVDNALLLLSHELGHVKYIIPHLAEYAKFYARQYPKAKIDLSYVGHGWHDQSGKYADTFQKKFVRDKKRYLQNGGKKTESVASIFYRIRRNTRNFETAPISPDVVSNYTSRVSDRP